MQRQKSSKKAKKERYCTCRTTISTGFMIQCEKCEIWFHGNCININKKEAEKIPHFFCAKCTKQSNGQCQNPDCINEAQGEIDIEIAGSKRKIQSKYCSNECGERYNKMRYEKFFLPKWNKLRNNPSMAWTNKLSEINRMDKEIEAVHVNIGRLKNERGELESMIIAIKSEASRLKAANNSNREMSIDNDSNDDDEDSGEKQERAIEQPKTLCVTCGTEQSADKAFKHWYQCHKKQETQYHFTSDAKMNPTLVSKYDNQPHLFCERECEKKGKGRSRYCMHIASACPQHSNWQPAKDEVCGCPSDIMQELKLGEDYCLELKSECNQHYNWDKFRLAMKDMERIQEFNRLGDLIHRSSQMTISLRDTYGGVVGILLHDTKDYEPKMEAEVEDDSRMVAVD